MAKKLQKMFVVNASFLPILCTAWSPKEEILQMFSDVVDQRHITTGEKKSEGKQERRRERMRRRGGERE